MGRAPRDWVLWIVPGAVLALGLTAVRAHGPYYWSPNFDPEYCYLVNAVNLLTFQAPAHTDHPGTTLQELTAAVCFTRWLASSLSGSREPLDRAVLRQPEACLHAVNLVLNLLLFGLLYWAGRRIRSATGSLRPALVFQATFLLFRQILLAQTRVSPEPLLMIAFLALAGLLAPLIARPEPARTHAELRTAALAGAATGFGIVTKVTFAPVALLGLAFYSRRARIRFLSGMTAAAGVFLIPIYAQLPRVAGWLWALLARQGRYGSGEVGLPGLAVLAGNAARLWAEEPLVWLLAAFFLATLPGWVRRRGESTRARGYAFRFFLAGLAGLFLSVALTIKHYAAHYALPAMMLAALLNGILAAALLSRPRPAPWPRLFAPAFSVLLAGGLAYAAQRLPGQFSQWARHRAEEAQLEAILGRFEDCTVTGVYRCSLPTFALHFGNNFAALRQQRVLAELYPGTVHYHSFVRRFLDFGFRNQNGEIARKIQTGGCVLAAGQRDSVEAIQGFRWEPVGQAGGQIVVRLTGVRKPEAGRAPRRR